MEGGGKAKVSDFFYREQISNKKISGGGGGEKGGGREGKESVIFLQRIQI